jgi:predicted phage baseplate assembly protein
MSCTGTAECTCGCCAGTDVRTPRPVLNPPGLSALSCRVGTWSTFKDSMLARLSSADYPALQALTTRSDDDFTIAFLDATAVMLDILTFYQERLANESYLRTSGQLQSLTDLSRLIGYRSAPGVSASTYLAFSLKQTPGQPPDPGAAPIVIPQGTKVQSVPAQGQTPQTFETFAEIQAKPEWNALPVQKDRSWTPKRGDRAVYLDGTSTQLQPGDLFLIVGDERIRSSTNENWDIRVVASVKADSQNRRTYVTWNEGLGAATVKPAQSHPKFFAFRQRAALFGYNAVSPLMLDRRHLHIDPYLNSSHTEWDFLKSQSDADKDLSGRGLIDLDAIYPKIVPDSWIALIAPDQRTQRSPSGLVSLYLAKSITTISRSDFALSAKISRVAADNTTHLTTYYQKTRETSALVQSEELTVAEQPLSYPLYGAVVALDTLRADLVGVQVIALSGVRQKIAVADSVTTLQFTDRSSSRPLEPGEVLTLTAPPSPPLVNPDGTIPEWSTSTVPRTLYVEDASGRAGTVTAALEKFVLAPADKNDPVVSEYALVAGVDTTSDPAHTQLPHTRLLLASPLTFCYDRSTTTVNANVGLATHGQSVSEVLGNGDPTTPNQTFKLKQSPLTYVQAPTSTGRASTINVRVDGVDWSAVPSLYGQGPSASVYTTFNQADGTTDVRFGDGVEGALLPTGQSNVQATYRIGSGLSGNVGAGALTSLIDRPLGVSGVTNPQAATGGQDPQSVSDIRENAPLAVLTLGRAVSVADYANFTRSFAGIAKAHALWIPSGPGRGVFLTVAGAGGAALPAGNPTLANLIAALKGCGNPLIPISAQTYVETLFSFAAAVRYDPAYDQKAVEGGVRAALSRTFSFAARDFGQAVGIDEITAVIQGIAGVVAVNVTGLTRGISSTGGDLANLGGYATISVLNNWLAQQIVLARPFADTPSRLCAFFPVADPKAVPQPAEILVLDPDPAKIALGTMS